MCRPLDGLSLPRGVTQSTLVCDVSAQGLGTQGFISTHYLAHIKIPDSQKEGKCLTKIILFAQSRHSEQPLPVREQWKLSLNPSAHSKQVGPSEDNTLPIKDSLQLKRIMSLTK